MPKIERKGRKEGRKWRSEGGRVALLVLKE
jgi:hypothetical protein